MVPTRIVGIGASAGGLASLEQLFSALPADTGMAFVIIQHLSPDYPSMMDELLGRVTAMPVAMADHDQILEANHVYLLPPAKLMAVQENRLVLTERVGHAFTQPIDTFLRSLAHDASDRGVAVILSGSGTDGSRGIVDVKTAGGMVLVESPEAAKFDGMPNAACATRVADHVLPAHELAAELVAIARLDVGESSPSAASPTHQILQLLEQRYGIDFSLYKMTTVARRIQRRLLLARTPSLADYLEALRAHRDELDALYHDLLIGVTQFFRDPDAYQALEEEVIPKLLDAVPVDEEVRVWVAGCATGEEAYSIAMLMCEAFEARNRKKILKILATDVHEVSLATAATGIYAGAQLENVSSARLARFFAPRPGGYQVTQDLRQFVVFARHDVTRDAPFTRIHLITCRNMLIYLEPGAYRAVIAMFHFGLVTGGYLFLGASESTANLQNEFATLDERWRIFQKQRDLPLAEGVKWPTPSRRRIMPLTDKHNEQPLLDTYDQLLDVFMPPGFLVDEDRTLIDSFAGAERLLSERARRPSRDLGELLSHELKLVVVGAIRRALDSDRPVTYAGVHVDLDGPATCTLVARGLRVSGPRRYVVVTLEELARDDAGANGAKVAAAPSFTMSEAVEQRVTGLETDLKQTRELLHTSDDQLKQSNEHLQGANEELMAMNEELQSTNEELQSVNEELYTLNAENQKQIAALRELNADVTHLLEDTDIGTVFLDASLRIRRFTTRMADIFRFRRGDVGRKITDFSHSIKRPQLYDDLQRVLDSGEPILDEVQDPDGKKFFLRIVPVRKSSGGEMGVILSLTDLTKLEAARESAT